MVNFAANWLLIPSFGAVGAAWTTLVAYVVLNGSYLYYTQLLHPIVIKWSRLSSLVFLGLSVALVSVTTISLHLDWYVIAGKISLSLFCFILGWKLIPVYSVREMKS